MTDRSLPLLGAPLRDLFLLQSGATFLNHGSFGAVPAPVRQAQEAWRVRVETQPDVFFRETAWTALRETADRIGRFAGAEGGGLVFVPNVTEAVATVLDAMRFGPGDEIVLFDVAYAAVKRAVDVTCARTGAQIRPMATGLRMTPAAYAEALRAKLSAKTRLVLLDHIVSPTAQLVPIEALIPIAREAGARVFVDGAHAIGQLRLDITRLGADWYASNAHKWLFAPRGCCVLYTAPEVRAQTHPVVVSHYYEDPYPRRFDYVGTRDVTPYLAAAAAADFVDGIGLDAMTGHRAALLAAADQALGRLGATPVIPRAPALAAWALPQSRPAEPEDGPALMKALWREAQVQIAASATHGRLLLRLSLQVYNDTGDIDRCATALGRLGWPGR
ncbi:MAG: aminotransferase class V-fold PLP-dependent enzyme [Alphaproteobacteria bacterium]|nr:aminotransferase class V-fold PLP-dependent enzyme [Alphaproteobacteria bacterium]